MTRTEATRRKVAIMGAAGRDFHNFNMLYRDAPDVEVIAFTATQIPGIAERRYPPLLAGPLYPEGIPILAEADLEKIAQKNGLDQVIFAYSDVTHEHVMHQASRALALGADFSLPGPQRTMLTASCPVVAVCALRTGCGKSQTARWLAGHFAKHGLRVAVLRHPMPYGDLSRQVSQRFASPSDLDRADCTIEEREEYEPYIRMGHVIFAGVDYGEILRRAEQEADLILWDGGNNDYSFIRPDLQIVIADALRPGQATHYFPGEVVLRMADILVINKVNSATPAQVEAVSQELHGLRPTVPMVQAASEITLEKPERVTGRRVLVVEDGPTITHGGMPYGAGYLAAKACYGTTIVDPRPYAVGSLSEIYERFSHIGPVLPAMGYGASQLAELVATVDAAEADLVVGGTPADLSHLATFNKEVVRVRYDYADVGEPTLGSLVDRWLATSKAAVPADR